jgi:hypothetical protein
MTSSDERRLGLVGADRASKTPTYHAVEREVSQAPPSQCPVSQSDNLQRPTSNSQRDLFEETRFGRWELAVGRYLFTGSSGAKPHQTAPVFGV